MEKKVMPSVKEPKVAARALVRVFKKKALDTIANARTLENLKTDLATLCTDMTTRINKLENIKGGDSGAEKVKLEYCSDWYNQCQGTPEECEEGLWACLATNKLN
jgi:hypothetical protein